MAAGKDLLRRKAVKLHRPTLAWLSEQLRRLDPQSGPLAFVDGVISGIDDDRELRARARREVGSQCALDKRANNGNTVKTPQERRRSMARIRRAVLREMSDAIKKGGAL